MKPPPFGTFRKIHLFWYRHPSLTLFTLFKLRGLTGSCAETSSEKFSDSDRATATPEKYFEDMKHHIKTTPNTAKPLNLYNTNSKTESSTVALVSVEASQLDEQIKSMMTITENEVTNGKLKRKAYVCNICGKEGHPANIKTHIEANHIENISHSCDVCGKISRSRDGLRNHKAKYHSKQPFLQD